MNHHYLSLFFAIAGVVLGLASCQKAQELAITGPTSIELSSDGSSSVISFISNRDWTASWSEPWIKVSPSSGSASDKPVTIAVRCDANTTYDDRTAMVTIKSYDLSQTVSVNQPANLGFVIPTSAYDVSNDGQYLEVPIQANVNYTVKIDEDCKNWISQAGTKALTSKTLVFRVAANDTFGEREGKITIQQEGSAKTETIIIRQGQNYGLFVTTPNYEISNDSQQLNVEVKANVEYEAYSEAEWIKIVDTKALATSTITLAIAANDTYSRRVGRIRVKEKNGTLSGTVTITQKQTDGLFVTPTEFDLDAEAQKVEIEVQSNVDYDIVIPDSAKEWIKPDNNLSTKALVSRKLVLSVSKNETYDDRDAKITIKSKDSSVAEQVISMRQQAKDGLELGNTIYEVGVSGGTLEIALKTNVELEVVPGADWIHYTETKALDNKTVVLSIDANDGMTDRSGEVKISQKGGTLSSTVTVNQEKPVLTVEKTEYAVGVSGGTLEIAIQANVEFEVIPDADWIHYTETKALDNKTVVLTVDKNIGETRNGEVKISQKGGSLNVTVTVSQEGEVVDLGLSVKWRSYNLGATKPEEYGDYYAWGEVEPYYSSQNPLTWKDGKTGYNWESYKWYKGNTFTINKITKYCPADKEYFWDGIGATDGKTVLDPEDDAAHVALGGNWRMPTDEEWTELITQCTWTWTVQDGVNGDLVTSKKNGNSIFLPAAGYWFETNLYDVGSGGYGWLYGRYWSSSLNADNPLNAWYVYFDSVGVNRDGQIGRYYGRPIRPVSE